MTQRQTSEGLPQAGGLRERKRRETLERIAQVGLKMFVENGYDETTLQAVAQAANISARTFFYYFRTKEDILQHFQGAGFLQALGPAIRAVSPEQPPVDAVRDCLVSLASRYETEQSVAIDRLLRSTEALRVRKQATFAQMEATVFESLCEVWPRKTQRGSLRVVAMLSIGIMRLAMDSWREGGGRRVLAEHVREGFARLKADCA